MTDELPLIPPTPRPSADRPLAGLTVLVVEDSRFASEAIRLLCLKSGARIRRADCLESAHRHLGVYRPSVVIVDMGLPDGSGADLIAELSAKRADTPVIFGLSGDPESETAARAAGADGFLAKPVESLAAFQQVVLDALPEDLRPRGPRVVPSEDIAPDAVSLAEDLLNAADLLGTARETGEFTFLVHFLRGVALSAHDTELGAVTEMLAARGQVEPVSSLLAERLAMAQSA